MFRSFRSVCMTVAPLMCLSLGALKPIQAQAQTPYIDIIHSISLDSDDDNPNYLVASVSMITTFYNGFGGLASASAGPSFRYRYIAPGGKVTVITIPPPARVSLPGDHYVTMSTITTRTLPAGPTYIPTVWTYTSSPFHYSKASIQSVVDSYTKSKTGTSRPVSCLVSLVWTERASMTPGFPYVGTVTYSPPGIVDPGVFESGMIEFIRTK